MGTYRATTPAAVAAFAEGEFERDFTVDEEQDWLRSGVLVLVPSEYLVLSNNYAAGKQGETVKLALPKEHEQGLIDGGHLQKVVKKPPAKADKK